MLTIITAQPNIIQYCWQTRVQIINFRQFGYSELLQVLVLIKKGEKINKKWLELQRDFPEVKFFWYEDTDNLYEKYIIPIGYESLIRPYALSKHFQKFTELSDSAIFYIDSDVLFIKEVDFESLLNDNINYLSNTVSYIGSKYFDSKINQVLPERLEEYKKIDVLDNCMKFFGLDRKFAEGNELNSGGAQYLLKNIDVDFWKNVLGSCIILKVYLQTINKKYFRNENEGFQSFCSDMWAVLYCLWQRGTKTKCTPELNFVFATDLISNIESNNLYHDAGITPGFKLGFLKSHYRLKEPENIEAKYFNQKFCTSWYVQQIEKAYLNN